MKISKFILTQTNCNFVMSYFLYFICSLCSIRIPKLYKKIFIYKHFARDGFELLKNVKVDPPPSISSKSYQLRLASALLSISPKNLANRSSRSRRSVNKQISESLELNEKDMLLYELELTPVDVEQGKFFSSDIEDDSCLSSKDFQAFSPVPDKDQLIICRKSRSVISIVCL